MPILSDLNSQFPNFKALFGLPATSSPKPTRQQPPTHKYKCTVCRSESGDGENAPKVPTARCTHPPQVCVRCLQRVILAAVTSGEFVSGISCPSYDCPQKLGYYDVKQWAAQEVFDRYDKLLLLDSSRTDGRYVFCVEPSCTAGQQHAGGKNNNIVTCYHCGTKQCFRHQTPWHEGLTCEQWDENQHIIANQQGQETNRRPQNLKPSSNPILGYWREVAPTADLPVTSAIKQESDEVKAAQTQERKNAEAQKPYREQKNPYEVGLLSMIQSQKERIYQLEGQLALERVEKQHYQLLLNHPDAYTRQFAPPQTSAHDVVGTELTPINSPTDTAQQGSLQPDRIEFIIHDFETPSTSSYDAEAVRPQTVDPSQIADATPTATLVDSLYPPGVIGNMAFRSRLTKLLYSPAIRDCTNEDAEHTKHFFIRLPRTPETVGVTYQCTVEGCKGTFNRLDRATNHFRTHIKHQPYMCTGCDREKGGCGARFYSNETLKAHEVKKMVTCEICGAYLETKNLRRHQEQNKTCKAKRSAE